MWFWVGLDVSYHLTIWKPDDRLTLSSFPLASSSPGYRIGGETPVLFRTFTLVEREMVVDNNNGRLSCLMISL